ncbi:ribonuclease D [Phytohalomonas tamaricis]|uniref:ribonuclease D n=1 Tax=Phytohalomonas tamaricis TaxID=2081032 RepID=UPI0021D4548C|nr:ribonuclease D [Phytohalomonas tamaricis]
MISIERHWVATSEALKSACQALANVDVIGVDTEFMRETTFHPIPALIQLGTRESVYLIDPQAVAPNAELKALMGPDGPLKLLHACSEDMDIFSLWLGDVPRPLVDTQIAQGLLGGETAMSYQRLVAYWLDENIPKDATRSNWLARPLSEEQCAYAALDVAYLPDIWKAQQERLRQYDRLGWLEADCAQLVDAARTPRDDSQWLRRHRQAWRLSPRQLALLQRLSTWREGEVQTRDIPRGRLVSDALLYTIAETMPKNRYELAQIEDIKPTMVKREGDAILAIVREALALDEDSLPEALPSPLSPPFKKRLKALKKVVAARAEGLEIEPELLARRRELETWVAADLANRPLPINEGWRSELLAEEVRKALITLEENA